MSDDTKAPVTRTDIEKLVSPAITEALATGTVALDFDVTRRLLRALVHLGVRRLLAAGASPMEVASQMGEALAKELRNHAKQQAADGIGVSPGPVASA